MSNHILVFQGVLAVKTRVVVSVGRKLLVEASRVRASWRLVPFMPRRIGNMLARAEAILNQHRPTPMQARARATTRRKSLQRPMDAGRDLGVQSFQSCCYSVRSFSGTGLAQSPVMSSLQDQALLHQILCRQCLERINWSLGPLVFAQFGAIPISARLMA